MIDVTKATRHGLNLPVASIVRIRQDTAMETTADHDVVEAAVRRVSGKMTRDLGDVRDVRLRAAKRRHLRRQRALATALLTFVLAHVYVWVTTWPEPGPWDAVVALWTVAGACVTVYLWPEREPDDGVL